MYTTSRNKNILDKDHQEIIAINGSDALMKCNILVNLNLSQYMNISWIKSPRQILTRGFYRVTENTRFHPQSPAILNTQSFNLKISPVILADEGQYRCNFIFGREIFVKEVTLIVQVPPKIIKHPSAEIKIDEGKRLKLTCVAFGKPQPDINWFFVTYSDDLLHLISIYQALGKFDTDINSSDGNLVIEKTNRKMRGTYRCIANSSLGITYWDTKVSVLYPPEINMANEVITQNVNQNTVIECILSSYPMGQINWYFGNNSLKTNMCGLFTDKSAKYCMDEQSSVTDSNEVIVSSRLNLISLTKYDFGFYSCKSKTLLGSAYGMTMVKMTSVHSQDNEPMPFDYKVYPKVFNGKPATNQLITRSSTGFREANYKKLSGHKSMELHQQSLNSPKISFNLLGLIVNVLIYLLL